MKSAQMLMMNSYIPPAEYGRLYNWYAATDANFPPIDWKVPEESELQTLATSLGGLSVAGGKMKEAGLTHWNTPNTGADNSSGLTILGSGHRAPDGIFSAIKVTCYIHSATEVSTRPYRFTLQYNSTSAVISLGSTVNDKKFGGAVRLLYTGAGTPSTVSDNDGNIYDVVLIGSQYWTVQNWKCTTLSQSPFTALTKGGADPNFFTNAEWAALTTEGYCAYNNDEGYV